MCNEKFSVSLPVDFNKVNIAWLTNSTQVKLLQLKRVRTALGIILIVCSVGTVLGCFCVMFFASSDSRKQKVVANGGGASLMDQYRCFPAFTSLS